MTGTPRTPQQYGTPEQKAAAGRQYAEGEVMSVWEGVKWRDQMIRELREALKFYADCRSQPATGLRRPPIHAGSYQRREDRSPGAGEARHMTKFSWMIEVKWVARTREEIEALIEALKIMKPLLHRKSNERGG